MDPSGTPRPRHAPRWPAAAATLLAALATVAALAAFEGVRCGVGGRIWLTSRSFGPRGLLATACVGALALLRRRHRAAFATWAHGAAAWRGVLATLVAVAAGNSLAGPNVLYGDAIEYIVQTQSIALDGRIAIDTAARATYWNRVRPAGVALGATRPPTRPLVEDNQSGGGFGGLYADNGGRYRYYHFWGYPAFVAPAYRLAHVLDPSGRLEYQTFRALNAALVCLALVMAGALWPGWVTVIVLALALLSPLVAYTEWHHPEIYCFFFTFAAFWATERGRRARRAGPALLGVAASQNLPLLLLFPLHLLHALVTERPRRPRAIGALALRYVPGCLLGLGPLAYFRWHFGTVNPIATLGLASTAYASAGRVADMFFSPLIGALWLMPAFVLLLVPACTRRNAWFVAGTGCSVAAAAWLASSTRNFNAGQLGTVRYLVWLSAPLLFAALRGAPRAAPGPGRAHRVAFAGAALLTALVAWHFHDGRMLGKDVAAFGGGRRAQPEVAAVYRHLRYRDDVEVLTENILGHELEFRKDFNGVYVWNLGRGRSVWIVSGAALDRLQRLSWPAAAAPAYRAEPTGSVRFEARDGTVRLLRGTGTLAVDAVYGRYARVWMDAEPRGIAADVPLSVR
jgi:hypothetical protein